MEGAEVRYQYQNHTELRPDFEVAAGADLEVLHSADCILNLRTYFHLKNHLGNIQMVVSDLDGDGQINNSDEIISAHDYYPFGDEKPGPWQKQNPFHHRFNGKERLEDFDLGLDMFGARFYDPALTRFMGVDPLADEPEQVDKSPYAYAWNNPINLTDPDGNCPKCIKALVKTVVKSVAKGKVDLGEVYDIVDAGATLFSSDATLLERGEALFNLASPVSTKDVKAISNIIEGASDVKKNTEKARSAATTGQEAHRQIQKELQEKIPGTKIEERIKLNDGTNVRKDAVKPDGTAVIIKPDTPSGQKSAKARENLMQKNGHETETILYDPKNPAYQPGSPTYIGPKKKN